MKNFKTVKQVMQQKENNKVVLFKPIHSSHSKVMRPGKTNKDHNITKCWGNRFTNQLKRVELNKGKK